MDGTMGSKVKFCVASEAQLPQILSLYRSVIGKEGCTWDMFYPSEGTLKEDFAAKQLYVLQTVRFQPKQKKLRQIIRV